MSMNGPAFTAADFAQLAETVKAHDYAIGKLASLGADVERLSSKVSDSHAELLGQVAGLRVTMNAIAEKLGVVDLKASAADAKADTADAKATRASLTNEAAAPAPRDASATSDSMRPDEKAVALATGRIAVDILRGTKARIGLLMLALIAAVAGGTRIQACASPSSPPPPVVAPAPSR